MKRTAVLPALTLALSLALTGCGGGNDDNKTTSDPTTAAAISQADFLTQADAICADGNTQISTAGEALGNNTAEADIIAFVTDTLIPNVQGQHDAIEALGAPAGDEDEVTAILDALQQGIDSVTADPGAVTTATDSPFAEANTLALAYGLKECGAA